MIERINQFLTKTSLSSMFTKDNFNYLVMVITLITGLYLNWYLSEIFFLLIVVGLILFPQDSRSLAKISLISLVFIPVLIILNVDLATESVASAVFVFLTLSNIMAVYEIRKKKKTIVSNPDTL